MLTSTRSVRSRLVLEELESRTLLTVWLWESHVHFEIGYNSGAFHLQLMDSATGNRYEADEAWMYLGTVHQAVQQPSQNFIGAGQGNRYWRTPQPSTPGVLTLALSAQDIPFNTFESYRPRDTRVTRAGEWIKFTLRDVYFVGAGTAHVSTWRDQQPADEFWVSSYDGGRTQDPVMYIEPGDHIHYNFGFSKPGYYAIAFEASAFVGGAGLPVRSGDVYFFVAVEPDAGGFPQPNPPGESPPDIIGQLGQDDTEPVEWSPLPGTAPARGAGTMEEDPTLFLPAADRSDPQLAPQPLAASAVTNWFAVGGVSSLELSDFMPALGV